MSSQYVSQLPDLGMIGAPLKIWAPTTSAGGRVHVSTELAATHRVHGQFHGGSWVIWSSDVTSPDRTVIRAANLKFSALKCHQTVRKKL